VTLDKPWRRPGRAAYARKRIRAFVKPPITVVAAPADLRKLHDVPVTMRDGVRLRANVYLPTGDGPFPVILSAHPYGKDKLPKRRGKRWSFSFQFRIMNQPQPYQISSETGWEAPDPVWWTQHGYAVINADLRGAGTSEGTGTTLSDLEGRDVYDLIEWAGSEAWSIGKVGMLGVSYLALSQYRAAALHPPHLSAIAPWEGFTDAYRDFMTPGGIVENGFSVIWQTLSKRVARLTDDLGRLRKQHPLRDEWWESITPDLGKIEVPILACASFSDHNLHSQGSWRLFERAGSAEKFAYTHRGPKWAIFYSDDALQAQLNFFDKYLLSKDVTIPRVRLETRSSRSEFTVRDSPTWPPAGTSWRDLYLGPTGLSATPTAEPGSIRFHTRRNAATFSWTVPSDLEISGPMELTLWASVDRGTELNLFVGVEKWSDGAYVPFEGSYGYGRDRITQGHLRASLRALDSAASAPHRPEHAYLTPAPLTPHEPVPLTISLADSSTRFRAGDELRLIVAGRYLEPRNPVTGHFPAHYVPSAPAWCSVLWGAGMLPVLRVPTV
jgi:predicted acyl esterase